MKSNCTKWLARLCCVLAAVIGVTAPAATNSTARSQPARWLFVVDTSAAMERRGQAIEGVLVELLSSGVNGEMQAGDEIGIWTYNQKLYAGVAPMQSWDPGRSNIIAGRSSRFVAQQKFKDKGRVGNVIVELNRVVKASRRLTVLLFSDGSQTITGTPFDEAINAAYAGRKADLAKTRMPLVTVLRSERGEFIGQTVSFAPWPIEFPPFQPEPEKKTLAPTVKPVVPTKSIIISGEPRNPAAPTNSLPVTGRTNVLTVPDVQPVPMAPVAPTPTVEPPPPATLTQPEPVNPGPKPVELAKVELPPASVATPAPALTAPTAPVTAAPVAVVEPVKPDTFGSRKWLLILGIGCMWVAVALALIWMRRSKRAQSASLITRSFDRDQR